MYKIRSAIKLLRTPLSGPDRLHALPLLLVAVNGMMGNSALGAEKKVDFSNLVIVGDSLSAGYQNSQLISSGQTHGYANVIATQAHANLELPLLPPPGYPQISIEDGYAVVTGLTPIWRLNDRQTLDVAVPGYTVGALALYPATCGADPTNPIYVMAAEILNPLCATPAPTELAEAAALGPSASILWIGSNDALFRILLGLPPTDQVTFSSLYDVVITTMAKASPVLVVANIPDVTLLPYLTSIEKLADILNLTVPLTEGALGLNPGDMVTPYAFPLIQAMGSSLSPLPDFDAQGPVVIRAAELETIRAYVIAYNAIIAQEATANGAVLVDIYSLVNDLAAHGKKVGGHKLTTDFMGGLFSLDGVHPTNTGYAIIANEFIKTMNRSLAAGVPPVSIEKVAKTDPLIFSDSDHGKHSGHVSESMAAMLGRVMK